jgi:hypothetical protein
MRRRYASHPVPAGLPSSIDILCEYDRGKNGIGRRLGSIVILQDDDGESQEEDE